MNTLSLHGLRCLVTGSRGGIGSAVVDQLSEGGARVIGVDRDDFLVTTTEGALAAVTFAVEQLGGLDAVIHTVGQSTRSVGDGPVSCASDDGWEAALTVNVGSAFRVLRASFAALATAGGSFVAIGSVLADSTDADFLTVGYAASKSALTALVRTSAREAAQHGMRVNIVAPGLVDTPMAARALTDDHIVARINELQPLNQRAVSAQEVANAAVWLASPSSAMTTGHVLRVDGGWSLR